LARASEAFTHSLNVVSIVGAALMATAALLTIVFLRGVTVEATLDVEATLNVEATAEGNDDPSANPVAQPAALHTSL
jgi:hypothetical protein